MGIIGIIASRACPHCGHHEIGLKTKTGEFHALSPGTLVQVLEGEDLLALADGQPGYQGHPPQPVPPGVFPGVVPEGEYESQGGRGEEDDGTESFQTPWIPEPLRGDRGLRLKYGVMLREKDLTEEVSPQSYQSAYMMKLRHMMDKEVDIPLAIILDRFFSAPNLASGDSKQVAIAMWNELDEIRAPVTRMQEWLTRQDEESLSAMIHPGSGEGPDLSPVTDEVLKRELEGLTLEEFLELL